MSGSTNTRRDISVVPGPTMKECKELAVLITTSGCPMRQDCEYYRSSCSFNPAYFGQPWTTEWTDCCDSRLLAWWREQKARVKG